MNSTIRASYCPKFECIICMESFEMTGAPNPGLSCPEGHFLCYSDLPQYLVENVFPQVYKMREGRCAVPCPAVGCKGEFNPLMIYKNLISIHQQRYRSMISELVLEKDKSLQKLLLVILDHLNLKCPTCRSLVDPFPDACSAVLCVNCGGHYCNYCFKGYSSGNYEQDKAAAHTDAASHYKSNVPTDVNPFLPHDLILQGHREYRFNSLTKCLHIAMGTNEFAQRCRHDVALSLILAVQEIIDQGLDIYDLWEAADSLLFKTPIHMSEIAKENATDMNGNIIRQSSDEKQSRPFDGGQQLANALKTNNFTAALQILESYRENLDVNYSDATYGPLAILALLTNQTNIARILLERGADPLAVHPMGRNMIYIAIEKGFDDMFELILQIHPDIDINAPITTEEPQKTAVHVAASFDRGMVIRSLINRGANLNIHNNSILPALIQALISGYEWSAAELILGGADVTISSIKSENRSAVYVAVEKGFLSTVLLMIRHCPIEINAPVDANGSRMIHVAVLYNRPAIVSQLIALGADVNILDNNQKSPVQYAVSCSNNLAAIELIRAGADPTYNYTWDGRTLLYTAIMNGLIDVVQVILDSSQATLSYINTCDDEFNYSSLMVAIVLGHEVIAIKLLRLGADMNIPTKNGRTCLYVAVEKGLSSFIEYVNTIQDFDVNQVVDSEGNTMIHVAALYNQKAILLQLISMGADVNRINNNGNSCLIEALLNRRELIALILVEVGADCMELSFNLRSPLFEAISLGYTNIVKTMLNQSNIDINAPITGDKSMLTALQTVIISKQSHLVSLIIEKGANIHQPDEECGCSPIMLSVLNNDVISLKLLLRNHGDPRVLSKQGRSPLYSAVEAGYAHMIRILLEENYVPEYAIDVNAPVTTESDQRSAIHIAAMSDHVHCVLELMSLGADIHLQDAQGKSSLDIAKESNSKRVEALLQSLS